MARSKYIYVLYIHDGRFDVPAALFTVKHEMLTYIERHWPNTYMISLRYRDGKHADSVMEIHKPTNN